MFEESKAYRWFKYLKNDGCLVVGYVIMPNHFHALLFPTHTGTSLNKLVGEGKRFMACDIVNALKKQGKETILEQLRKDVKKKEKRRGKKHQVFRLSFDGRKCFTEKMIEQKLDYIHHNPVNGKWNLVEDFTQHPHLSVAFYKLGVIGEVELLIIKICLKFKEQSG